MIRRKIEKRIKAWIDGSNKALLISGAKALGEFILEEQKDSYQKLEERREADKEAARRITAVENGEEY